MDLERNKSFSFEHDYLFGQVHPLFVPVLPSVFVAEPEEDGSVHGDGLDKDERTVQDDVDHIRVTLTELLH